MEEKGRNWWLAWLIFHKMETTTLTFSVIRSIIDFQGLSCIPAKCASELCLGGFTPRSEKLSPRSTILVGELAGQVWRLHGTEFTIYHELVVPRKVWTLPQQFHWFFKKDISRPAKTVGFEMYVFVSRAQTNIHHSFAPVMLHVYWAVNEMQKTDAVSENKVVHNPNDSV